MEIFFTATLATTRGSKHLICQTMFQRLSEQIAPSNQVRGILRGRVSKTVDASFDTINAFDSYQRLVTLEATSSVGGSMT